LIEQDNLKRLLERNDSSGVKVVKIRDSNQLTQSYRALVAELVYLGLSCAKCGDAIQACAYVFGVQLEGTPF